MRYKFITSVCLLVTLSAKAQKLPTIRDVVKKFYATYNLSAFASDHVDFIKKKDNWYIATVDFDGMHITHNDPFLFYSAKEGKFLSLGIDRNGVERHVEVDEHIDEYSISNFNLQPYYGYPGWYNDVINEWKDSKKLDDDELYALGRAYSARATAITYNTAGEAAPGDYVTLPLALDVLTEDIFNKYSLAVDSAISKFKQLYERNEKYATRVGTIRQKWANEWMTKYHALLTLSPKLATSMIVPNDLYAKEELENPRDWLKDCDSNSVFLSFGDNDLYPLLYLQKTEGYRNDVLLINYSLLGIDRFIFRATQPQLSSPGLRLSVDTAVYKGVVNEYHPITKTGDIIDHQRFIEFFKKEANSREPLSIGYLDWSKQEGLSNMAKIPVNKCYYLLKNHWVLLDILANLNGRRFFMASGFVDEMSILNNLFISKGGLRMFDN